MGEMQALGRTFNVVPIASGVALNMRDYMGVTFVCTGADTFTLTASATFAGTYASPGNVLAIKYSSTATNGTAAWTKSTFTASNANIGAAGTNVYYVGQSMIVDPLKYVKFTASASGLVMAILGDVDVQRGPANLAIVSA